MKLLDHHYGKARIRVAKVTRAGEQHSLKELDISVMLQGRLDVSHIRAGNSLEVPVDTIKNIVNILAREKLGMESEPFGLIIGGHFLEKYPHVETVQVRLSEGCWEPVAVQGKPHSHTFVEKSAGKQFTEVTCSRTATAIHSGVSDLMILKTGQSGFEGFDAQDACTTLLQTKDRIFATQLRATWCYVRAPSSYARSNARIQEAMLEIFALAHGPSAQATLYQMGEAALKAAPEISKITLAMPNKHCLRIDLGPSNLESQDELFLPANDPQGQIEGTISRE